MSNLRWRVALVGFLSCSLFAWAQIPEQYPRPLLHTPTNHPADRVLIVIVDGMRAVDLENWVEKYPQSALAKLSLRGVSYTNAHVPWPDSAAGMMSFATGGTPISTGIFSSDGYDRSLSTPGAGCLATGAELNFDVEDSSMPHDPAHDCAELQPHKLVRVNSIFDLVHAAGGRTAWADERTAYADLLRGSSGTSLDEVFVPEIPDAESLIDSARIGDEARVRAVLRWIDNTQTEGPRLFGVALMSLDAAQRTASSSSDGGTKQIQAAFGQVDRLIGKITGELEKSGLNNSTWIIVTARHGHAPTHEQVFRQVDPTRIQAIARVAAHGELARVTADTVGIVWLKHPAATVAVLKAYRAKMTETGIGEIYSSEKLRLIMNTSEEDSRMPDIVLEPQTGVIWMHRGEDQPVGHGGFSDDQNHVALLVSGRQLQGRMDKTPVPITQIAPLILRILGMEKMDLKALHQEHTPALPGIF